MEVKCLVEECYAYHDSENAQINERAQKLAGNIEYALRLRKTFCNCQVEKYIISLPAKRTQTAECKIITGCCHKFEEQLDTVTLYANRNFLS